MRNAERKSFEATKFIALKEEMELIIKHDLMGQGSLALFHGLLLMVNI